MGAGFSHNPSESVTRIRQNPSKSVRIRQNPSKSVRIRHQNPSKSVTRIRQNPSPESVRIRRGMLRRTFTSSAKPRLTAESFRILQNPSQNPSESFSGSSQEAFRKLSGSSREAVRKLWGDSREALGGGGNPEPVRICHENPSESVAGWGIEAGPRGTEGD